MFLEGCESINKHVFIYICSKLDKMDLQSCQDPKYEAQDNEYQRGFTFLILDQFQTHEICITVTHKNFYHLESVPHKHKSQ